MTERKHQYPFRLSRSGYMPEKAPHYCFDRRQSAFYQQKCSISREDVDRHETHCINSDHMSANVDYVSFVRGKDTDTTRARPPPLSALFQSLPQPFPNVSKPEQKVFARFQR